ncbi:LOW QUALITY PROTEIN: hypothetical protein HID58_060871 [Brassica napus]|uniref:Uncharacterized protein n=1 Tax=Brassica napus TaxID=3708 RepID=A0ABQ7ZWY4_BRANA|nr:LOW QUALITY PROTEIN: hypothetical protein HID58_060871 [Brassica napus]
MGNILRMQVKESKGLVLKRDETKVRDIYKQGRMFENFAPHDTDGDRTHKLTFHRRGLEIVTGSYIIREKIEAKNKKKRLWRHIDFEHPASFQAFSIRKEYYKKTGKAWKRAYLLYGPLGTGKSTMTAAMVNRLNYNLELAAMVNRGYSEQLGVEETSHCSMKQEKEDKSDLFSKKDGEKGKEDQNQSRVTLSGVLTSKMGYDRLVSRRSSESLLREAKIAPPDVPGKLMARNHKIDVDASLKDLVQSLVRRKTYDTSHRMFSDDKITTGRDLENSLYKFTVNEIVIYC